MSEARPEWATLRQSATIETAAALEQFVAEGSDADLHRVNPLAFASRHALSEDAAITAFLYAARLGTFDMSWNVLCPGCGGVLDVGTNSGTPLRRLPLLVLRRRL